MYDICRTEDLKQKADEFRRLFGIQGGETFPALRALEHDIGVLDEAFKYQIVDTTATGTISTSMPSTVLRSCCLHKSISFRPCGADFGKQGA